MSRKRITRKRRRIPRILICVFIFIFLGFGGSSVGPRLHDEYSRAGLSQDMRVVFEEHRKSIPEMMAEHEIPGLSIAVVDRDGILWTAGFGYADDDRKRPVTPETIFSIQSVSKTFTATAVMFAVQDGLVELDAPITKYVPDFSVNSRFEENPQERITLRHLLTHTSGLARDTTIGNNEEARFPSFEDHVKSISDTWLKHTVGERLDYSNIGFDLAAYIVQIRSGKPFAEYMKEKLFDPLDMPNSSADMVFIEPHPKRSIGHRSHFEEVPLESPYLGAGGVYTSAKEFARFIQFHLNWGKVDGQTVLDEGHMRTLYTASTTDPSIALGINIGVIANGTFGKYSPLEATKGYVLSHSGGGYGFSSVMGWLPEYGIGFLVLANSQDDDDQLGFLLRNVALRLIKKETIEKRFSFNVPACKQVKVGSHQQRPAPDTFTPYDPTWRRYTGTYKYMTSGWKLHAYARIELALGGPDPSLKVKVYENNGYLEIDGERLDEHLPGLFFTYNGECFDFRGPIPTWQNLRMKKIK